MSNHALATQKRQWNSFHQPLLLMESYMQHMLKTVAYSCSLHWYQILPWQSAWAKCWRDGVCMHCGSMQVFCCCGGSSTAEHQFLNLLMVNRMNASHFFLSKTFSATLRCHQHNAFQLWCTRNIKETEKLYIAHLQCMVSVIRWV